MGGLSTRVSFKASQIGKANQFRIPPPGWEGLASPGCRSGVNESDNARHVFHGKLAPMPELPDITIYVEALERHVVGQTLNQIRVASPFLLRTAAPPLASLN